MSFWGPSRIISSGSSLYLRNACKRFIMELRPNFFNDINVAFYNIPFVKRMRELSITEMGKLVSVSGIVTLTRAVGAELLQSTFKCLKCESVVRNVDQQFKYTELIICSNATCENRSDWALLNQESKFTDWQRVRIQEITKEIPAGSLPRSLDVIICHEIAELARAGDIVVFTGRVISLASPGERYAIDDTGQVVRASPYRLGFMANSVEIFDGGRRTHIRKRKYAVDDVSQQALLNYETVRQGEELVTYDV